MQTTLQRGTQAAHKGADSLLEKRLGVQGRVGDPAQAAGSNPVTLEAPERGYGQFRDIPQLSCQKDGQNIKESWKNGRKNLI